MSLARAFTYVLHVQLRHSKGRPARVAPLVTAPAAFRIATPITSRSDLQTSTSAMTSCIQPPRPHIRDRLEALTPLPSNSILILITC